MRHAVQGVIVLLLGLVVLSSCSKKTSTEIEWVSSLEDAYQLAVEKDQPIIAEFWSDG